MAVRRASRIVLAIALGLTIVFLLQRLEVSHISHLSFSSYRKPQLEFQKSTFDWSSVENHYTPEISFPLPTGRPERLPPIQHDFAGYRDDTVQQQRREAVRAAFLRSWTSYKKYAWLKDELLPLSGGYKNPFGGLAATLVDSLDSMWIMDLKDEFYEATLAAVKLDWNNTTENGVNLFETTIRHLGGLLSAYDLSGEEALLLKARELGEMLYMAFDTPNGIPGFWIDFEKARDGGLIAGNHDPSAAPTSLSLEFTRLAQITGEDKYYDAIARVSAFLDRTQEESNLPGMWPAMINFRDGKVGEDNSFGIGALADSLYEYLPKMYVLLGGREGAASYEKMYRRAMEVVKEHVLFRPMLPGSKDVLFAGTVFVREDGIQRVPEGQHLACFVGGMFGVGGKVFDIDDHIQIGERLTRGCAWAYQAFPTGVMPEIFNLVECPSLESCKWDKERWKSEGDRTLPPGFRHARDPRYLLRPEAIESIFILYRITGHEDLREIAWQMFESIMTATKTPLANSAIRDVTVRGETEKQDSMESFWLSETLKYFYLIFSPPDVISLDRYVLNTEAHPFKRT